MPAPTPCRHHRHRAIVATVFLVAVVAAVRGVGASTLLPADGDRNGVVIDGTLYRGALLACVTVLPLNGTAWSSDALLLLDTGSLATVRS